MAAPTFTHISLEIRVRERLLNRNALLRVECLTNSGVERKEKKGEANEYTRVFVKKSTASGFAFGKIDWKGFFFRNGNARI